MNVVESVRRWIPPRVRYAIQRHVSFSAIKLQQRERANPYANVLSSDDDSLGCGLRFGIARNAAQYHSHFVAACLEIGVPFRVLDLYADSWLADLRSAGCDALLVWPDAFLSPWNEMIKDRAAVAETELGMLVVPSSAELWLYENKRRMAYWLQAHDLPHPRTWVFYERKPCLEFVGDCELPIVFKASFGASGAGVRIFRRRHVLKRFVHSLFRHGFVPSGFDHRDRQWGSVLLQEYVAEAREWRLARIGDSFFGHAKGRVGDYHSGTGSVVWDVPESRHLDFLAAVTEAGRFRSMGVDVFEAPDGRLLVNELQAVFGASHSVEQLRVDGVAGRFVRREKRWDFEAGDFARNACANERVRWAVGVIQGGSNTGSSGPIS